MIFDTLNNYARYMGLENGIPAALNFLLKSDLTGLPVGRTDIDGNNLYALIQEYATKNLDQGEWEAHRKYIDVQYMVSGRERMGFTNICTMQPGKYVAEDDFLPMAGTGNYVEVFAGTFVIFFPEDGHMPGLNTGMTEMVKKVVLKVKILNT